MTLKISMTVTGAIMGIDYSYQSGDNITEIYVDDKLFVAPTVTFNYDFSQRHILIVNNNTTVEQEIKVVFGNKKAADTFNGLVFSGFEEKNIINRGKEISLSGLKREILR